MNETTEHAIFSRLGAMGILGLGIQGRQNDLIFFATGNGCSLCLGFLSVLSIVKHTPLQRVSWYTQFGRVSHLLRGLRK